MRRAHSNESSKLAPSIGADSLPSHVPPAPSRIPWPWRLITNFADWVRNAAPWTLPPTERCITLAQAIQVFVALKNAGCSTSAIEAPCITFLYPDQGSYSRAHAMCRLILNMGIVPRKVWLAEGGVVLINTPNNPNCLVGVSWNVAPTVCVRWLYIFRREMVLDPAFFTGPVTKTRWLSIHSNGRLVSTRWQVFLPGPPELEDPDFFYTDEDQRYYREALAERVREDGPPPYANCL